jgi:hypothetical protein
MNKCSLGVIAIVLGMFGCSADSPDDGGGQSGGTAGSSAGAGAGSGTAGTGLGTAGSLGTAGTGLGTAGTGFAGTDGNSCTGTGAEAEVGRQGADIIWVVDNSCSMATEAEAVRSNMNRFTQNLIDDGIDVNLVLISATSDGTMPMICPDGDWACLLQQIASGFNFGVCIEAPFG